MTAADLIFLASKTSTYKNKRLFGETSIEKPKN